MANEIDPIYKTACDIVLSTGKTRISSLQLTMRIGYNRAACLIEAMEVDGIITPMNNRGERKLITNTAPQK